MAMEERPVAYGALTNEKDVKRYQSERENAAAAADIPHCSLPPCSQNGFPRSSSAYWLNEDHLGGPPSTWVQPRRRDQRIVQGHLVDGVPQADPATMVIDPGTSSVGKLDKSNCKSLDCFNQVEVDMKKPVVVFVKDQRDLERRSPTVVTSTATNSNSRGLFVHRRPTDLTNERYLYHIGGGAGGGGAGGGVEGGVDMIGSSQTLPLNVLRSLSDSKRDRPGGGGLCIAWPRKTDKIYTSDDDRSLLCSTTAGLVDTRAFPPSTDYGREAPGRRDPGGSFKRMYPGHGQIVDCSDFEKDSHRWTVIRNPSSGYGGHLPPHTHRCSGVVAPATSGSRTNEFLAGDGSLYRTGWQQHAPHHHHHTQQQQQSQPQQLVVSDDGRRIVVTTSRDQSSHPLPDTKV